MIKNNGTASRQIQFIKGNQDVLYAIYQRYWTDQFSQSEIRDVLTLHGENRGFMTRCVGRGLFETENSHDPRIQLKYKMTTTTRDAVIGLKGISNSSGFPNSSKEVK